jgi:Cu-Zn family superoxide dismutase
MFANRRHLLATAFLTALGPVVAWAQAQAPVAKAELHNSYGVAVGSVELREMHKGTLLHVRLDGLPAGAHALHVHATGQCEPPFDSAGGHYNPYGLEHGFSSAGGHHAGDLPNIHVPASGRLEIEVFSAFLLLDDQLFDDDGAAVVIHEGADDYASQPAGAAGPRIACGVIGRT